MQIQSSYVNHIAKVVIVGLMLSIGGCESPNSQSADTKAEEKDNIGKTAPAVATRQFLLTVVGFGVEVRPKLPVGVAHLDDGTLIFGPMNSDEAMIQKKEGGLKNALLKPGRSPDGPLEKKIIGGNLVAYTAGQEGTTLLVLGKGMDGYDAVFDDIRTKDHPARWTIVTDDHEILWPSGFTLRADGDLDPRSWPYEFGLDGSAENLLFLEGPLTGPDQIPAPEKLIAPNQELVDEGQMDGSSATIVWVELGYEYEGAKWRQRLYYLPMNSESVYLLRAQGRSDVVHKIFNAADQIASSFRPRG